MTDQVRLHRFYRSDWQLWAGRVPAIHGRVNLYTLWQWRDMAWRRVDGGLNMRQLRALISTVCTKDNTHD